MTCLDRRTQLLALCAIASSTIAVSTGDAQAFSASAPRADVATVRPFFDAVSDSIAGVNLNRAQSFHQRMRFTAARREYLEAAKKLEAGRHMPCHALWKAAEMYYAEGNVSRAAATLDLVAQKAAAFGHPDMQASALFESAILYEQWGAPSQATTRLQRLDALLTSPVIPEEVRATIAARRK